jgi:RNA polymerase sigma-70 factor (ECF subfamily)
MKICRREIEKTVGPMLKYSFALCRDSDLACDLVQDSIVKALSARNLPERDESCKSWLFSILRNVFFDHLRRTRRWAQYHDDAPPDEIDCGTVIPVEQSLINRLTVRSGLARLSGQHREILVLIDVAGFSYGEAAELLGIPPGTVMSRLSRARQRLRQEISSDNLHTLDGMQIIQERKAAE